MMQPDPRCARFLCQQ